MQTIYIDISNKGIIPTIYTKQGDIGRKFEVIFKESNLPYSIPSDSVFSAWYKGDSGEGNYTDIDERSAFEVDGDRVVVELISQMLGVPGSGFICLVLSKADGGQIGSWNIPYVCEEVPGFDSEEATAYYTAFSSVLEGLRKNPENIAIDKTLSNSGEAADAKVTGEKIKELQESIEGLETPGGITDEEFVAKVERIVATDIDNGGYIRVSVESVANECVVTNLQDLGVIRGDYSLNVVTNEQLGIETQALYDYVDQERDLAIERAVEQVFLDAYTKTEVDAKVAEGKAVIVTVSGSTPSHTSQQIFSLIQAGKVVYLELWGNTYTLCTACTASEAKFENSYITSTTGADGKSYQAQQFRVYLIKNGVFNNGQAVTVPGTDYINAQIAHALGQ